MLVTTTPSDLPAPLRLTAGVVAYNEELSLEGALHSLLTQELPPGASWDAVWVVASGCTDGTVEVARRVMAGDARVHLVVEEERRGKTRAMQQVFEKATGDALVLLNADARAEAGAIASLLEVAPWGAPPWAVMARPVIRDERTGPWAGAIRSMWEVHNRFHGLLQEEGGGGHLSDELLLLSLPNHPQLPEGIIGDGSYLGVWLEQNGGRWRYAENARVTIQIPHALKDHLHQRRRILVGNDQVGSLLGVRPTTLVGYSLAHPGRGFEILRSVVRSRRHGGVDLMKFVGAELVARALAIWDEIPPRRDHVRWRRIASVGPSGANAPAWSLPDASEGPASDPSGPFLGPSDPLAERRVASVLEVARSFRTGVPLEELAGLLPSEAPRTPGEVQSWLSTRPLLARLEGGRAFHPSGTADRIDERRARGREYRAEALALLHRDLAPVLPWLRCLGLSGSAAYGEPDAGDDLDMFVVTRAGALWCFLAYTYLALRFRSRGLRAGVTPAPCLNLVLTDDGARSMFATARGFLFAREALNVDALLGAPYYRGLLQSAPWMREEIPRMYAERAADPGSIDPAPVAWPIRLMNAALYLPMAGYVQLVNLRRNAHARWSGSLERMFRTETTPRRLAFVSDRFDRLRVRYIPATSSGSAPSVRSHGPVRPSPE